MRKKENLNQDPVMLEYCKKKADVILYEYNLSSLSNSNYDLGFNREYIIRNLLEGFLPSNLRLCSGEVIDIGGNKTGQIDLLIIRGDSLTIDIPGPNKIYPIEGVISSIEIKTNLEKKELKTALDQLEKICKLIPSSYVPHNLPAPMLEHPMTVIFAYKGKEIGEILKDIDEINQRISVDIIAVLNKGILIRNELINYDKKLPQCNNYTIYEGSSEVLSHLLYHLLKYCSAKNFGPVNYSHYWKQN